jgi:hypothetical protein
MEAEEKPKAQRIDSRGARDPERSQSGGAVRGSIPRAGEERGTDFNAGVSSSRRMKGTKDMGNAKAERRRTDPDTGKMVDDIYEKSKAKEREASKKDLPPPKKANE